MGGRWGLGFNYQYHKAGTGFPIHRNLDIYLFVNTRDLDIIRSEAADSWTPQALVAMPTSRDCDLSRLTSLYGVTPWRGNAARVLPVALGQSSLCKTDKRFNLGFLLRVTCTASMSFPRVHTVSPTDVSGSSALFLWKRRINGLLG